MTRQDTIKELRKAGKDAELKDVVRRHGERAQRSYDEIRNDDRTSDKYKSQRLAQVQVRVDREVNAELDRMASQVVQLDRDDASAVFGVKGISGDQASLLIARRDAGDRVSTITDTQELSAMLRRASRSGDEVMARAIAERATEIGSDAVMNAFLADRPDLEKAGERLWRVEQATNGWDLEITGLLGSLGASEFRDLSMDRVAMVAETEPTAEPESRSVFDGNSAVAGAAPMASAWGGF